MTRRKRKKLQKKLTEKMSSKSPMQILLEKKPEILNDPYYAEVYRRIFE